MSPETVLSCWRRAGCANHRAWGTVQLVRGRMGSGALTGSAACLRAAYCSPFVGDNWPAIVAKYVRQIEADGSDSDTWLSQGCGEDWDSEEGWCRSGPRLALVSAFNRPMCPCSPSMCCCRDTQHWTFSSCPTVDSMGAATPTLHLPQQAWVWSLSNPLGPSWMATIDKRVLAYPKWLFSQLW